jgi:hypothetical protein
MNSEREWDCADPKNRVKWAEATLETLRVLEGKWKIIILCQLFAAKGPLRFSDLEKLIEGVRAFANEIGAVPADISGVVRNAEVIFLSIPFPAVADLPADLFASVPLDVPVVDTGNYYPGLRDQKIPEIDEGMAESVSDGKGFFQNFHAVRPLCYSPPGKGW